MIAVRVPASTANIGPGFDALGIALSITAVIGVIDSASTAVDRRKEVDEHHPAAVAFAAAGGVGRLWVRSAIPMARGLGYSGAMRVGGATAAIAQQGTSGKLLADHRRDVFALAARLEGHADNAAASLYGGIVATDGAVAVPIRTPLRPDVILWIPPSTTLTSASRTCLPASVPFEDALFNVCRTAMLVAALAAGEVDVLRAATQDRLHQERRFAAAPESRRALADGLAAGAWCGWLSGSGPAVALLVAPTDRARVAAALPADGHTTAVGIDFAGAVIVGSPAETGNPPGASGGLES